MVQCPSDVSLRFPVCRASELQTPANAEVLRLEAPSLFHQRARSVILSEAELMLNSLLVRREGKSWLEWWGICIRGSVYAAVDDAYAQIG